MSVDHSRALVEQLLEQAKELPRKRRCAASLVDAIENHEKLTKAEG